MPRARAAVVWTGRELFFWGGDTQLGSVEHKDGAMYEPQSGRWRSIPPAPIGGRFAPAAAWTGREVLVWGGSARRPLQDGAAYDPRSGAWRKLPAAPLEPRRPAVAVWTGEEMLVWGDADRFRSVRDGAAYDPAADRWRRLPPAPFALNLATATWTGEEAVIVGAHLDGNNHSRNAGGLAYDPHADRWRVLPPYPLSPQASSVGWTDATIVVWDYLLAAAAYDPKSDSWSALPALPFDAAECYPQTVRVGAVLFAWYCGQGATLGRDGRWNRIADPPETVYGAPVAAETAVFFAGAAHEGQGSALWAWTP